jgi:hypothetical protein
LSATLLPDAVLGEVGSHTPAPMKQL